MIEAEVPIFSQIVDPHVKQKMSDIVVNHIREKQNIVWFITKLARS